MSTLQAGAASGPRSAPLMKSLLGPLLIFLAAVGFFFLTLQIDPPPGPEQLGAAFWPRTMLILLMAACGIKGAEILLGRGKGEAEETPAGVRPEVNIPRLAAMILTVVGGVFFMDLLGFPLSNFIFLFLFMRIAGLRKKAPLFLISFLGTLFLLYLFVKIVYLPLPKGQWLFNDLTIFLYRALSII